MADFSKEGREPELDLLEKAIVFAARAHDGQKRKSTETPYITHPYAVGMLLLREKCSEEAVAAGILHDTLEDTSVTYEELLDEFGERVAKLVLAASEPDKSLPWEERKEQTIQTLKEVGLEELQIITADKLHNLRSIRGDLERNGEEIWSRFKRGREKQRWYYASIVKELSGRKNEFPLIEDLENEVLEVFGQI